MMILSNVFSIFVCVEMNSVFFSEYDAGPASSFLMIYILFRDMSLPEAYCLIINYAYLKSLIYCSA